MPSQMLQRWLQLQNMRSALLFLFLSFSTILYSQNVTISNQLEKIVYVGLDNPISISADNVSTQKIVLKTDNGKLSKYQNGSYNYIPDSIGLAQIEVYLETSSKLKKICVYQFRAKEMPLPKVMIGACEGGKIKKEEFVVQLGVRAENIVAIESSNRVDTFSIIILKQDSTYFLHKNIGAAFDQTIKSALNQLQAGDRILITDVTATLPNKKAVLLKPAEFDIR